MTNARTKTAVQHAAHHLRLDDPNELIDALGDSLDIAAAAQKLGIGADALAGFFPWANYESPTIVTVSVLDDAREELVRGELVDGLELTLPTHTLHFQDSTFTLTPNSKAQEPETIYELYFSKAIIRAVEKESLAKRGNAVIILITGLATEVIKSKVVFEDF